MIDAASAAEKVFEQGNNGIYLELKHKISRPVMA